MENEISANEFRKSVKQALFFLEQKEFIHHTELDVESSVLYEVVYRGRNVGFTISFDVRDQLISAYVIKLNNGIENQNWNDGFSKNLFEHLLEKKGYRGHIRTPINLGLSKLEYMIAEIVALLKHPSCSQLIEDNNERL